MTTLTDLTEVRAERGSLLDLSGAPLVAITSVKFQNINGPEAADPLGYETARFQASLAASTAYADAGVPQVVMFDGASHYQVPVEFGRRGAIVVRTPRPGLATPYLDAARLVQIHTGGKASVLKAESDKQFTPWNFDNIRETLRHRYHILVGDRTEDSLATMSPMQHRTEAVLDSVIATLLDVPHGVSSGVQVYTPAGLEIFLRYEDVIDVLGNNWKYLAYVPALANEAGLEVTSVPVEVLYDAAMVAAENTPALQLKRLEQLLLMLEGTLQIGQLLDIDREDYTALSADRTADADAMLAALRALTVQRQAVEV